MYVYMHVCACLLLWMYHVDMYVYGDIVCVTISLARKVYDLVGDRHEHVCMYACMYVHVYCYGCIM